MKKSDCPRGTVAWMGQRETLIVKGADDWWRYVDSGERIDYDDYHKCTWDVLTFPSIEPKL